MYKVFFNDSTIELGLGVKKSLRSNIEVLFDLDDYSAVIQMVGLVKSDVGNFSFCYTTPEIDSLWKFFRSQFVEIPAAGGLVQNMAGELLFIKRLGFWDLPKGKLEKKETPENAAVREVEEECGLSGIEIVQPLNSTYHIYRSPFHKEPNNLVLKETKWFLMNYSGTEVPQPQLEEDIEEVRWVAPNELESVMANTYESLRVFLAESLLLI